jgi:uncharacterized protein (TIGR02246 family)
MKHTKPSTRPALAALLLASGLWLAAPVARPADTASPDPQLAAIRAVGEQWRALYEAGSYAEIPGLYTEDCLVMPRGRPAIVGREQMRRAVGGLAAGRKVDLSLELREIVVRGDIAWSVAEFVVRYTPRDAAAAPHVEHARSLVIYRRDADGRWRIHRDIDAPAPEPPATKP